MEGLKRMNYKLPIGIMLISFVFLLLQFNYLELKPGGELSDAAGETVSAILVLIGLFIAQRLRAERNVYTPLILGLTLLYFSTLTDAVYEFLVLPKFLEVVFEDTFHILGISLIAIAGWRWINIREMQGLMVSSSEAKYRGLVEASLDAIVSIDENGKIVLWNKAAQKMFGYTQDEIVGTPVTILMPEEYTEKHIAGVKRYLETGIPKFIGGSYETEGLTKEGRRVIIELSLSEEKKEKGRIFTGIIRDVTERKEAERRIKEYTAQLEDSNRMKDLFTDILSHDLMNPAGIIKNAADLMREDGGKEELEIIVSNAQRIIEIITMASSLGKLETMESLDKQSMDLGAILRGVCGECAGAIDEKGQKIILEAPGKYEAEVNPMISQVFVNLLSNAIKYSPEKTTITIGIAEENDSWRAMVKDQGEGIRDEDKDRLFTRFKRLSKKGVRGTGLGLSIAKRIVDLHGGKIWVEDNPLGGSIFNVRLPKKSVVNDG